ncbi:hypothetical protein C1645_822633 [Glomus cerebriforme]|uniref:Uncharacterized protein n=1 Tax=Glomus cerebriforme TaxID=658196 RepID=A0A397T0X0_9GLOM|nr:hypothetical protein C1645_822633 [Glomus cerebriforme]
MKFKIIKIIDKKLSENQKSLSFQSNTRKWEWSLSFQSDTESGNDSPSVRTLGIKKQFLDFVSGSNFFQFQLENLVSFEVITSKLSFQNVNLTLGIHNWKHKFGSEYSELEIFSSGNSGLEIFGSGNGNRNIQLWK